MRYSSNESSSGCFLDNENNREQICLIILLFPVDNTEMKRDWDTPFFQLH